MVAWWPLGVEGMWGTICGCPGAGDGSCMRTSRRTDIVEVGGQGGGCGKREAGVERWAVFKDQAQPPAPLARSWRSARSSDSACLCVPLFRLFPLSDRDPLLFFSRAPSFSGVFPTEFPFRVYSTPPRISPVREAPIIFPSPDPISVHPFSSPSHSGSTPLLRLWGTDLERNNLASNALSHLCNPLGVHQARHHEWAPHLIGQSYHLRFDRDPGHRCHSTSPPRTRRHKYAATSSCSLSFGFVSPQHFGASARPCMSSVYPYSAKLL
jgi:hypothetical protein